ENGDDPPRSEEDRRPENGDDPPRSEEDRRPENGDDPPRLEEGRPTRERARRRIPALAAIQVAGTGVRTIVATAPNGASTGWRRSPPAYVIPLLWRVARWRVTRQRCARHRYPARRCVSSS